MLKESLPNCDTKAALIKLPANTTAIKLPPTTTAQHNNNKQDSTKVRLHSLCT